MSVERICYNCKYYRDRDGKYGFGTCNNWKSRKRHKDLMLKKDTCIEWRDKYGSREKM